MSSNTLTAVPLSTLRPSAAPATAQDGQAADVTSSATVGEKRKKKSQANGNDDHADDDDDDDESSDVHRLTYRPVTIYSRPYEWQSMINVDFDFYNPNPDVDDIALKRLLTQLLSSDAQVFDVHSLAAAILAEASQMGVGTTVKVDGEESDPYAYLSIVDLSRRVKGADGKESLSQPLQPLINYILNQLPAESPFRSLLSSATAPEADATSSPRIALVVSERLVNLPVQLMPPMWKMMRDEVEAKLGADKFTHYLLLSRVYRMEGGEDDEMDGQARPTKKTKKLGAVQVPAAGDVFHYHPEEEFLEKVALHIHTFSFKNSEARHSESFGVEQRGRISLYEAGKLPQGILAMEQGCV